MNAHPGSRTFPRLSADQSETYSRYLEAHHRLDAGLIRPELTGREPERSMTKWTARMDEMRSFLRACGDPQQAFPAIHVTGTSGKGSVCTFIAESLRAAGYRVGLHVSPFLQSQTEKIWIDGELLDGGEFADLVDWVWPVARPRRSLDNPASIHGMASVAVAFEAFRRAAVDVAVVEAGCGGRFDLTSFVRTAAAVVTSVGMDHVGSLGPTLADIAWHKAGILRAGAPAVTGATGASLEVIRAEARELGVSLVPVEPADEPFWEANARVADAALDAVAGLWSVPAEARARGRAVARMPARREAVPEPGRTVIVDGAHNPDKMAALARTLPGGCVAVLGCLEAKDAARVVDSVGSFARRVVATEPRVLGKPSTPAAALASLCRSRGLEAVAEPEVSAAVEAALELSAPNETVVVTGSLYLAGAVRDRWYPAEQVVLQRSSWPEPTGAR